MCFFQPVLFGNKSTNTETPTTLLYRWFRNEILKMAMYSTRASANIAYKTDNGVWVLKVPHRIG